jgi:hypothetical protein
MDCAVGNLATAFLSHSVLTPDFHKLASDPTGPKISTSIEFLAISGVNESPIIIFCYGFVRCKGHN